MGAAAITKVTTGGNVKFESLLAGLPVPPWSVNYETGEVIARVSGDGGASATTPLILRMHLPSTTGLDGFGTQYPLVIDSEATGGTLYGSQITQHIFGGGSTIYGDQITITTDTDPTAYNYGTGGTYTARIDNINNPSGGGTVIGYQLYIDDGLLNSAGNTTIGIDGHIRDRADGSFVEGIRMQLFAESTAQVRGVRIQVSGGDTSDWPTSAPAVYVASFEGGPTFVDDFWVRYNAYMPNLPTSDPGFSGQLWNDSGTVKVSP